ncbi:MAG: serine/threonine-protein kinase [Polyangiaceae bacterium]
MMDGYQVGPEIASGGMATVLLGRPMSGQGPLVAIKRIHPHLAKTPSFVAMFRDEARLAHAIAHANVVRVIELTRQDDDLLLVLEYVEGVTLRSLYHAARERGQPLPDGVVASIAIDLLRGLAAAHEACDEAGAPLEIIHRDVSPQNVLVGRDGVAKLTDFGVAKAVERLQTTREGQVKGKIAYMAPEQLLTGQKVDRRVDLYATGVVIWELVTLERLFSGDEAKMIMKIITGAIDPPSDDHGSNPAWDDILERALATSPDRRPSDARSMAEAIAAVIPPASHEEVGAWVEGLAGAELSAMASRREAFLAEPPPSTRADTALTQAVPAAPPPTLASSLKVPILALSFAAVIGGGVFALTLPGGSLALRHTLPSPAVSLPPMPTGAPSTVVTASASVTIPAPPAVVPRPRPQPAAGQDKCASPFYTDEHGVRRVRRECL